MTLIRIDNKDYEILDLEKYPFNVYNCMILSKWRQQVAFKKAAIKKYAESITFKLKKIRELEDELVDQYKKGGFSD